MRQPENLKFQCTPFCISGLLTDSKGGGQLCLSFRLQSVFNFSSVVEKFSPCFLWDTASLLPEEIIPYRSSICLGLPQTSKLIFLGGFAAWSTFFILFTPRGKTNNVMHTIQLLCYHMKCIVIFLYMTMEIGNSPKGASYQVILFHLVMQSAVEPRKRFLKKASEVVFYPLVKLGTLSFMTAKDHIWP